jgi:riboflavin biosynthesis pyrimidine reductase
VVTASGRLPSHVALTRPQAPVVVLTGAGGAASVRTAFPEVRTIVLDEQDGRFSGDQIVRALSSELAARLILCEGGPTLLSSLFAARVVHELFLTIAPQVAGRSVDRPRPGLLEGFAPEPPGLPAAALLSARRAADHLLLRYRFER